MHVTNAVVDTPVVVVVGSFNPAIFHPAWLASRWLLDADEVTTAEIDRIDPSFARFRCGWLTLEVTPGRLRAEAAGSASSALVCDFVVGVLGALEHTPVTACGINRLTHCRTDSTEIWERVSGGVIGALPLAGHMERPGLRTFTVQGRRPGSPAQLSLKMEPSPILRPHGLFFDFNEHFEQARGETATAFARDVLLTQWEPAQTHFVRTVNTILTVSEPGTS